MVRDKLCASCCLDMKAKCKNLVNHKINEGYRNLYIVCIVDKTLIKFILQLYPIIEYRNAKIR